MKTLANYKYFETANGVLYHGDCLEILPLLEAESIDLVLTDPPYGINADKGRSGFGIKEGKIYKGNWDSKIPDKKIFDIILKYKCIIFGGNYFTEYLKPTNSWIIWDKIGEYKFKNPFSHCEMAWTNYSFATKKYTVIQQGFISEEKERFHPTQKPIILFCNILNDIKCIKILDPFFGSGTTGIACEKLNRKWIGIEISEDYCKIAKKRILAEYNQIKMF